MSKRQSIRRRPFRQLIGRHAGEDVFCVATGASLGGFDFRRLDGRVTIALNRAVEHFLPTYHVMGTPSCTAFYDRLQAFRDCVIERPGEPDAWSRCYPYTPMRDPRRIEAADDRLMLWGTVATTGLTLAWKLGARRIFLLGHDACRSGDCVYFWEAGAVDARPFAVFPAHRIYQEKIGLVAAEFARHGLYQEKWPGSGVFNLSARSSLQWFEKVGVDAVLGHP